MKRFWKYVPWAIIGMLLAWLIVGYIRSSYVRLLCQKSCTELVMPYGIVLMGVVLIAIISFRERRWITATISTCVAVIHTVSGVGPIVDQVSYSLEKEFVHIRPLDEGKFDVVIVLGGGTSEGTNGQPMFSVAGDRTGLTARMYAAGQVDRIICTGASYHRTHQDKFDPSEESAELLVDLDVPRDKIIGVGGRYTKEEMQAIAANIEPGQRVGLITSAWHMKRALRLSRVHGLELEPLPADWATAPPYALYTVTSYIPNSYASYRMRNMLREHLARLVGR